MKKIALIMMLLAFLTAPDAESGSVFRDINGDGRMGLEEVICTLQSTAELRIDKKVGLPDALYVLKILAGSEGNAEETGMFRAYRADVLEQLQRTAKDESIYSQAYPSVMA